MRRPPIVLGLALVTVLALCVALGLILFSVNPGVSSNEKQIRLQQANLAQATKENRALICAQVQTTANAYRFRSLTPSGDVEPIRHFLTRMQAQAQTLRLARGAECKSAPGFPPVGLQVRRALEQIHRILMSFEPRLREPIRQDTGSTNKQSGFLPGYGKPSKGGIDESGVPAKLHDELAPGSPLGPQRDSRSKPRTEEEPEAGSPGEAPQVPKTMIEEDDKPRQAQTEVVLKPPLPEPIPPVEVEVSEEGLKVDVNLPGGSP